MSSVIECSSCGRQLRLTDELLGRDVSCPRCGATIQAAAPPPPDRPPAPEPNPYADEPRYPAPAPSPYDRPWEMPTYRRDGEPHRGGLILTLGILSIVLSIIYIFAFVGLGLGIFAWVLGSRDLAKMRQGVMDPQGQGTTQAGWICGIIGTCMSGLMSLCCVGYILFVVTMITSASTMTPPPPPAPVRPVPAQTRRAVPQQPNEQLPDGPH